uniref:Uncharacterized protein n=1 Tax=Poecilia formosa TaxID=48698 RepID=A0A096M4V0_POEFO
RRGQWRGFKFYPIANIWVIITAENQRHHSRLLLLFTDWPIICLYEPNRTTLQKSST